MGRVEKQWKRHIGVGTVKGVASRKVKAEGVVGCVRRREKKRKWKRKKGRLLR